MRSIILYILLVFGFTANGQKIRLLEEQRLATVVTIDTDLNNFLIASGIDDDQKSGALNYLITELKASNLWSKFIAIYPLVGGTASAHKWNLKDARDLDAAYRITWSGTISHTVNGAKGDGISAFGNTHLKTTDLAQDNHSMFFYSTETTTPPTSGGDRMLDIGHNDNLYIGANFDDTNAYISSAIAEEGYAKTDSKGFYGLSRVGSGGFKYYKDGAVIQTSTGASNAMATNDLYVLGANGGSFVSNRTNAFICFGEGLTDGEVTTLYNIVEQYNSLLGRSNSYVPPVTDYPPDVNLTTIDWGSYSAPVSLPSYRTSFTDDINGMYVTRVSDGTISELETIGDVQQIGHTYSKRQAWNADGSYILLAGSNPFLLDGNDYSVVSRTNMPNMWSNVNRLKAYGFSGTDFYYRILNESTYQGDYNVIRSFSAYNNLSTQTDETNFDNFDKYFVFYGTKASTGSDCWVVVYDNHTDTIVSETQLSTALSNVNWCSVSQDGSRIVIQYNSNGTGTYQGTKSYDRNLGDVVHLVNGTPHGDLGVSQAGDQVFVSYEGITGQSLSMVNLTTGVATGHWDDNGTSGLYGGHLSTRNIDRPGWAYISEGENPSAVDNNNAFLEILAVKLDGSGIVERFCKTNARNSNTKYYHQAQACPSPDGKKVIFKSDWDDGTLEANTYAPAWVVERVEPTLSLNYFEKRINYNEMYCDIYNHELKHLYNGQLKDFNKETHTVYTIVFDKKTLRRIYLK